MEKIILVGGVLHGKQMTVNGNVLNVPVIPNSRTPKQEADRISQLVYKKVKSGVFRIVKGYYEIPKTQNG